MNWHLSRWLLLASVLLCSSCMHLNVPPARLEFVSIRHVSSTMYDLTFTSDRDLINLYEVYGQNGQIGTNIHCSLAGDLDFSVDHQIQFEASGMVDRMRLIEGDRRFEFSAHILVEDQRRTTNRMNIPAIDLMRALAPQDYIPCKVVITAFPYVAYYSKVMYMPASRFMDQVRSPRVAPERVSIDPADRVRSILPLAWVCIVRWRYDPALINQQIDRLGPCSDVPYSGLLASFAPYRLALRLVSSTDQQTPKAFTKYLIVRRDGREEPGITDEKGNTHSLGAAEYETVKLFAEEGVSSVERWTEWIECVPKYGM